MKIHKCDGCRYKGEHQEMGFRPFGVCLKETNLIKAEQNFNAECCPYIVDLYAEGTAEELQKEYKDTQDKIETEYKKAVEAIQCCAKAIAEKLIPIIEIFEKCWETIKNVCDTILNCYPNKKVLHLALYHPKQRVRKKNIQRIKKWIEKGN